VTRWTVRVVKILLTGATGFIGSHALAGLVGHDLVVYGRRPLPEGVHAPDGARIVVAPFDDDTALTGALDGCDAVVHLAAMSNQAMAASDPAGCVESNVVLTLRLAQHARRAGVARFVFASSALVYGQPPLVPITEQTPLDPRGMYAMSKHVAETLLAEVFPEALVLRFFNVYGPRQRGTLIPILVDRLRAGEPVTLQGDGSQVRSFLYVDDAVRALTAALERDASGVLNVAGEPARVLDVAQLVAGALGVPGDFEFAPARAGDPQENWASLTTAAAVLGWRPAVGLADGIAHTVAHSTGNR
jgi:UDP-glucose 4-epimerase